MQKPCYSPCKMNSANSELGWLLSRVAQAWTWRGWIWGREDGVEVQCTGVSRLAELLGDGLDPWLMLHRWWITEGPAACWENNRERRSVVEGSDLPLWVYVCKELHYCRRCGEAEWKNSSSDWVRHPCLCASRGEVLILVDVIFYVHIYTSSFG